MLSINPRTPGNDEESFAMGFMLGYHGEYPDEIVDNFPDEVWGDKPASSFIKDELYPAYKRGCEAGQAFYYDHKLPEEGDDVDARS